MEIWKDIKDFENYYKVSSYGRIKSVGRWVNIRGGGSRFIDSQIITPFLTNKGYFKVTLHKNSKAYKRRVHRLVAQTFILNEHNKPEVNHINLNKQDNRIENLEWVTGEENKKHFKQIIFKIMLVLCVNKIN